MGSMLESYNNIVNTLKEKEIIFNEIEGDRKKIIDLPFGRQLFDNMDKSIDVLIFVDEDGGSVHVQTEPIVHVPDNRLAQLLVACNTLNKQYRWLKFYIDDENDVMVNIDAVIDSVTAGDECMELAIRTINIVDSAYPTLMQALWGGN